MKQNHKDMVHGALIALTVTAGLVLAYTLGEGHHLSRYYSQFNSFITDVDESFYGE